MPYAHVYELQFLIELVFWTFDEYMTNDNAVLSVLTNQR